MQAVSELWNSANEQPWNKALDRYWTYIQPRNLELEDETAKLDASIVQKMDAREWWECLHDKYSRWKYTAPNRYATTTRALSRCTVEHLLSIKKRMFELDQNDIERGLRTVAGAAGGISGLGIAGASGLLAVLFPAILEQ